MDKGNAFDLLIVGGGINGAGIARDAAGRGLKVLLCEMGDLASATSSASSKLIHGGLRYLEYYEFSLVRKALAEREVLLEIAPHIIWPLRFVLPHNSSLRPAWMVRTGLFLYDNLAKRKALPGTKTLNLRRDLEGRSLIPELTRGFAYSDCWVEDSRLVVLNCMDAQERGAEILVRTKCTAARREGGLWHATLTEVDSGEQRQVTAKALVNAAGPWVDDVMTGSLGRNQASRTRLVKGSHIIVPKLYEGDHAYILQNADKRIVFAIPYEGGKFTLIGTTDIAYEDDPAKVRISDDETQYLCDLINQYFTRKIAPSDVVRTYSGVRPLFDDGSKSASAVTRDYMFDVEGDAGTPALLSIYGGKITTYRVLAEHAMEKLAPFFPNLPGTWTGKAPLPGGDMPEANFDRYLAGFQAKFPWLPRDLAFRLCRLYGTRAERMLAGAASMADLGVDFGGGMTEREAAYLIENEWARGLDDIIWRRTKMGLHMPAEGIARLEAWLAGRQAARRPAAQ